VSAKKSFLTKSKTELFAKVAALTMGVVSITGGWVDGTWNLFPNEKPQDLYGTGIALIALAAGKPKNIFGEKDEP
jgi:hypothetical protein